MSSVSVAVGRRAGAEAIPAQVIAALVLAYILPGVIGHDPWKADEAYVFGGVYQMLTTGDWIVPHVAGVPFMEKPPLYHWVAALTARLASPWLALHDGARLASPLFMLVAVGCAMAAARLAWGRGTESTAALLLLSPLGLFMNAQLMITDLPLMAGFAVATLGFVACRRGVRWGPLALGAGVGTGFLAKGFFAPGALALAAVILPLSSMRWRTRAYARQLLLAILVALPFLVIWPAALWLRSPHLFSEWFWDNNVGRFLGFSTRVLGAETEPGFWLEAFPWFLFPLWVLVASGAWRARGRFLADDGVQIGLAVALALFVVLVMAASARVVYALPMLPPLALASVGVARDVPRWLDRGLRFTGVGLGLPALFVMWVAWFSLADTAQVPWTFLERWFPGRFAMPISAVTVLVALVLSGGFAWIAIRGWRAHGSGLATWVAALALAWGLAGTLWLPWLDHAKSYREMFTEMSAHIPPDIDCVGSDRLGESERAMMHYVLGITTRDPSRCGAFVRQGFASRPLEVKEGWHLAWTGARPGDTRERFELFVRDDYWGRVRERMS